MKTTGRTSLLAEIREMIHNPSKKRTGPPPVWIKTGEVYRAGNRTLTRDEFNELGPDQTVISFYETSL